MRAEPKTFLNWLMQSGLPRHISGARLSKRIADAKRIDLTDAGIGELIAVARCVEVA